MHTHKYAWTWNLQIFQTVCYQNFLHTCHSGSLLDACNLHMLYTMFPSSIQWIQGRHTGYCWFLSQSPSYHLISQHFPTLIQCYITFYICTEGNNWIKNTESSNYLYTFDLEVIQLHLKATDKITIKSTEVESKRFCEHKQTSSYH